jgi:hypothetical protein
MSNLNVSNLDAAGCIQVRTCKVFMEVFTGLYIHMVISPCSVAYQMSKSVGALGCHLLQKLLPINILGPLLILWPAVCHRVVFAETAEDALNQEEAFTMNDNWQPFYMNLPACQQWMVVMELNSNIKDRLVKAFPQMDPLNLPAM